MSLSRTVFLLALGLSINPAFASERVDSTTSIYQGEPQSPAGQKYGGRRRGGVGCIPPKGETLDVWTLNVSCENGLFCYLAQEEVKLWLPEEKRLGLKALVITTRRPRQKAELPWPASEETLPWPVEQMPIQSGVPHRMTLKTRQGSSTKKTITLYQIPAENSKTTPEQAQWMEQQGCTQQAEMLIKEQHVQKTSAPVEEPTTDIEKPAEVSLPPAN